MAKSGSKLSDKKLAAIQADYEAGIVSKSDIAKKHRINRYTLFRNAKRLHWEYGKSGEEVTRHITKKVTEKIVEQESLKLIDYTSKHLSELDGIRKISRLNIRALAKEIKDTANNVSKKEADRIFTIQKVCKITSETLAIIYKDERLAMGLDNNDSGNSGDIENRIKNRMKKLKGTE